MVADKNYWFDIDGNVTTDEAKSHIWLVQKGVPISKEIADKYGIGKVAQQEGKTDKDETVNGKSVKPSKNKSITPKENK